MRIRIGHELVFEVPQPTTILLMLYVRPEVAPIKNPRLRMSPAAHAKSPTRWKPNIE